MSRFLDRIFGTKIEVDLAKLESDVSLSFLQSQYDSHLYQLYFEHEVDSEIAKLFHEYQQKTVFLKESSLIPISEELDLVKQFIKLHQLLHREDFYIHYQEHIEPSEIKVPPFILFPIIQNAIRHGYSSLAKYPIKVRYKVYANAIQLEVSNRVNHHLHNQEITNMIDSYKNRLIFHFKDSYSLMFNSNSNTFKGILTLRF